MEDFAVRCDIHADVQVFPRVMISNIVLRQLLSSHQNTCTATSSSSSSSSSAAAAAAAATTTSVL